MSDQPGADPLAAGATAANAKTADGRPALSGWALIEEWMTKLDKGMVDDFNDDINTLLTFAGLFSAVVQGFLVQFYLGLQPDSSQTTNNILTQVTQQLDQISRQFMNNSLVPVTIPTPSSKFEAGASTIAINTLWFLSLVLSLAAALFGMMAKQWLREYLKWTTISRPSEDQVALRQGRYEAFMDWKTPAIIAAIPALLELALIIFLLGMEILLWTLNRVVFGICTVVVITVIMLVIMVTVLPVFRARCPYKSPLGWACIRMMSGLHSAWNRSLDAAETIMKFLLTYDFSTKQRYLPLIVGKDWTERDLAQQTWSFDFCGGEITKDTAASVLGQYRMLTRALWWIQSTSQDQRLLTVVDDCTATRTSDTSNVQSVYGRLLVDFVLSCEYHGIDPHTLVPPEDQCVLGGQRNIDVSQALQDSRQRWIICSRRAGEDQWEAQTLKDDGRGPPSRWIARMIQYNQLAIAAVRNGESVDVANKTYSDWRNQMHYLLEASATLSLWLERRKAVTIYHSVSRLPSVEGVNSKNSATMRGDWMIAKALLEIHETSKDQRLVRAAQERMYSYNWATPFGCIVASFHIACECIGIDPTQLIPLEDQCTTGDQWSCIVSDGLRGDLLVAVKQIGNDGESYWREQTHQVVAQLSLTRWAVHLLFHALQGAATAEHLGDEMDHFGKQANYFLHATAMLGCWIVGKIPNEDIDRLISSHDAPSPGCAGSYSTDGGELLLFSRDMVISWALTRMRGTPQDERMVSDGHMDSWATTSFHSLVVDLHVACAYLGIDAARVVPPEELCAPVGQRNLDVKRADSNSRQAWAICSRREAGESDHWERQTLRSGSRQLMSPRIAWMFHHDLSAVVRLLDGEGKVHHWRKQADYLLQASTMFSLWLAEGNSGEDILEVLDSRSQPFNVSGSNIRTMMAHDWVLTRALLFIRETSDDQHLQNVVEAHMESRTTPFRRLVASFHVACERLDIDPAQLIPPEDQCAIGDQWNCIISDGQWDMPLVAVRQIRKNGEPFWREQTHQVVVQHSTLLWAGRPLFHALQAVATAEHLGDEMDHFGKQANYFLHATAMLGCWIVGKIPNEDIDHLISVHHAPSQSHAGGHNADGGELSLFSRDMVISWTLSWMRFMGGTPQDERMPHVADEYMISWATTPFRSLVVDLHVACAYLDIDAARVVPLEKLGAPVGRWILDVGRTSRQACSSQEAGKSDDLKRQTPRFGPRQLISPITWMFHRDLSAVAGMLDGESHVHLWGKQADRLLQASTLLGLWVVQGEPRRDTLEILDSESHPFYVSGNNIRMMMTRDWVFTRALSFIRETSSDQDLQNAAEEHMRSRATPFRRLVASFHVACERASINPTQFVPLEDQCADVDERNPLITEVKVGLWDLRYRIRLKGNDQRSQRSVRVIVPPSVCVWLAHPLLSDLLAVVADYNEDDMRLFGRQADYFLQASALLGGFLAYRAVFNTRRPLDRLIELFRRLCYDYYTTLDPCFKPLLPILLRALDECDDWLLPPLRTPSARDLPCIHYALVIPCGQPHEWTETDCALFTHISQSALREWRKARDFDDIRALLPPYLGRMTACIRHCQQQSWEDGAVPSGDFLWPLRLKELFVRRSDCHIAEDLFPHELIDTLKQCSDDQLISYWLNRLHMLPLIELSIVLKAQHSLQADNDAISQGYQPSTPLSVHRLSPVTSWPHLSAHISTHSPTTHAVDALQQADGITDVHPSLQALQVVSARLGSGAAQGGPISSGEVSSVHSHRSPLGQVEPTSATRDSMSTSAYINTSNTFETRSMMQSASGATLASASDTVTSGTNPLLREADPATDGRQKTRNNFSEHTIHSTMVAQSPDSQQKLSRLSTSAHEGDSSPAAEPLAPTTSRNPASDSPRPSISSLRAQGDETTEGGEITRPGSFATYETASSARAEQISEQGPYATTGTQHDTGGGFVDATGLATGVVTIDTPEIIQEDGEARIHQRVDVHRSHSSPQEDLLSQDS